MIQPQPTPQMLADLQRSADWLRAGRHADARRQLAELLRTRPGLFDGHWLLATSYAQTGEFLRARKELQACARLRPGDARVQLLLGQVLAAGNQAAEAEQALRRALELDPGSVAAAGALARVLLAGGRAGDARTLLEPFARKADANVDTLAFYGHILMVLGLPAEAADAFAAVVERLPGNAEARLRLAAALADAGQAAEAENQVRTATRQAGRSPEAAFVLARALMGQGRFEEAEAELLQVVRAQPMHATAQHNLSELVWMRTGDVAAASAELDAALRGEPRAAVLRIAKARLLVNAHRPEAALETLDEGLALAAGREPALLTAAANTALQVDGARALDYARRALAAAPADPGALTVFGNASLAVGRHADALATADRLCLQNPANGEALAMRADALRMAGDPACRELLDYTGLVRAELLDVPEGWSGLAAYVTDLATQIASIHTLKAHPVGNSLRQGSQVELVPERSDLAAIRAFPQAIDGPLRRYMAALGHGDDPMRRRNSGAYSISGMWSVRLRANGFHVNHYHPQGWISSACYLHLPPAVAAHRGEGWLKFGEPAFPTSPALEPEYYLKPEPGLLALFPSYMWHGTVPFPGGEADSRLTIAFDAVPRA